MTEKHAHLRLKPLPTNLWSQTTYRSTRSSSGKEFHPSIRLLLLKAIFGGREALNRASSLKAEIASMKFFKYVIIGLRLSCADFMSPREGLKPLFLFRGCIVTT